MVPLRTSESDPFPVAIAVGHDNARAIGTDGEADHAQRCPVWSGMGQSETNVTTEPWSAVEWIADADLTRA
jgi:hypothetical protein